MTHDSNQRSGPPRPKVHVPRWPRARPGAEGPGDAFRPAQGGRPPGSEGPRYRERGEAARPSGPRHGFRYRVDLEYLGTRYSGWQFQTNARTVAGEIMEAIHRATGLRVIEVYGSGRTDAGVHATGQVAHVDLARSWDIDTVRDAINAHLRPHPVAILSAEKVASDFDARRSAVRRHYLYRIANRRPDLAIDRGRAWRVPRRLDADAMHAAAQRLVGKHDFTTFRSTECQAKSPEKTLDRLDVSRAGDGVHVAASARSFLHNQVRSMVGSLVLVGEGKWSADELSRALAARDRSACGPVAPPDGLYLVRVDY